ncbi:DUF2480 family protein [Leeuwenhoekiella nanhaiensis]|uniref:DUF2480 domain-containing protein n=1 Tax=Leeuwenhoekiella nanhaiensis TaxID=1655491 RepID=A0A2G1VW74_9FLAO|nr:DUF2480 family protein [Leeuwenhoekiella nanhaiensis]PHQ31033.1 hypothetical protein CJ305_02065 [Leeuwenhoekiella nanhaiensis]
MEEIVNRVANSKLKTFNLEDLYPAGKREQIDISQWLTEGFILREKDFRDSLKNHDWSAYSDAYVALHCSTNAIVPAWAYMLVTTYLQPVAKKVVVGNLTDLETVLYTEKIETLDVSVYQDEYVIVKGCSNRPVPQNAYILLTQKLQSVVKSLMFGEACSSVPLYKSK